MAPTDGYWGKVTSTIDWCEENYVVNRYVAEFWNTISNSIMIFAPMFSVYLAVKQNLEKPVIWSNMSVIVVGVGSWAFHMTLQYSMQLLDELPMIWGSAFLIYGILMIESKEGEINKQLLAFLFCYAAVVTAVYLINKNPVFHEIAYGLMVATMFFASIRILLKYKVNSLLYLVSSGTYLSGFLLWNVDNIFCHQLRSLRREQLHSAATPLFECHAWWHILAGTGTYLSLVFVAHTRYFILGRSPQLKFLFGFWPYVSVPPASKKLKQ
ncbi:alkaline ceramidase 3-like [Pomacea canaliculata]|uniref:alkaline ceramidase 3-like n=1 Tax=Pomacea canaliculata TaxID=400727 RepID=UPI000D73A55B|nr:alkaline ceramidase 3-like [Pomacea canaliculata]